MVYNDITELIGRTPLLRMRKFEAALGLNAQIFGKLEYFNPSGSVKDRVAFALIADAEAKGLLKQGSVIIEPTSGNTGVGLAAVAVSRGYRVIITMPETMSAERVALLKAYGAELALTDGAKGMAGAIEKARSLHREIPGSYMPGQFSNPANPAAHYSATGPEIWADTAGKLNFLVAGVGTGGTISGAGRYLKERNPDIKIIAVEPFSSPHSIQGIGAGFIPETLDKTVIDETIAVTDEDAFSALKTAAASEGVLLGISSGAALFAASRIAERPRNNNAVIVVVLPDTGERYLSMY